MIEVQHVTKTYGKKNNTFVALSDITFAVPEGSTVAIVGKSGSGKSTLMHVMSGLDSVDSGKVIVSGKNIQNMKRKKQDRFRSREMSFIFQSFFIEPNQSVYQNVSLPLEIAQISRGIRKKLIVQALTAVELLDKSGNRARDLSGGQKQRLAIARALVTKPKLIFADEPTGNLDSATGEKVMSLLFQLNKALKSTLFIVTHDHELAARCQIQLHIKDGKLSEIKGGSKSASSSKSAQKTAPSSKPPRKML